MINLNFSHKSEYKLHNDLIDDMIKMYGVSCKLIITLKQNIDFTVFGDWSNIKTNGTNIFDIMAYPAEAGDIERPEYQFSEFGLNYIYGNEVFVSSKSLATLGLNLEALYSALVVFPSNQVMEVTDVDFKVPGVNNLWAFSDLKSVIKLTLNTYQFKLHDNIEDKDLINTMENTGDSPEEIKDDIELDKENYKVLDNYFESLLKTKEVQDNDAEVLDCTVQTNQDSKIENVDNSELKPIVDTKEKSPFGW